MHNNPFFKKHISLSIIIIGLFILSSCNNMPQKVGNNDGLNPEINTIEGNNQFSDTNELNIIRPENGEIQSFSDNQPTVTPIVLGVEKRGEEGSLIVRTPMAQNSGNDFPAPVSVPQYTENTQYQNPGPNEMADKMELYSYNPVNGAIVLPGQSLHLDVTIKNTGTTTWQTSYKIVDVSTTPMAIQTVIYLPYAVAPGGTATVSIYMAAPSERGKYVENFEIYDAYSVNFGRFEYVLEVGDFSYITEIPTLTATITPTYYSAEGITATPDSLAWMCIDPERSRLQDCYQFCVEYSDRDEFRYCFYDGQRYETPVP